MHTWPQVAGWLGRLLMDWLRAKLQQIKLLFDPAIRVIADSAGVAKIVDSLTGDGYHVPPECIVRLVARVPTKAGLVQGFPILKPQTLRGRRVLSLQRGHDSLQCGLTREADFRFHGVVLGQAKEQEERS